MFISTGLYFVGECNFPLQSAMKEEKVSKRKPFARMMYFRSFSEEHTLIMKFYFYQVQFFFKKTMSVFLDLVEASGKRNTFDIERLVFHH